MLKISESISWIWGCPKATPNGQHKGFFPCTVQYLVLKFLHLLFQEPGCSSDSNTIPSIPTASIDRIQHLWQQTLTSGRLWTTFFASSSPLKSSVVFWPISAAAMPSRTFFCRVGKPPAWCFEPSIFFFIFYSHQVQGPTWFSIVFDSFWLSSELSLRLVSNLKSQKKLVDSFCTVLRELSNSNQFWWSTKRWFCPQDFSFVFDLSLVLTMIWEVPYNGRARKKKKNNSCDDVESSRYGSPHFWWWWCNAARFFYWSLKTSASWTIFFCDQRVFGPASFRKILVGRCWKVFLIQMTWCQNLQNSVSSTLVATGFPLTNATKDR